MPSTLLWTLLTLLLLLQACAEPRTLEGGPRDTQAPRLDSSKYSTPNGSTNFQDKEIILTFDEWIVLKDAANQILISPPQATAPEVKIKRKSVVLRFKDSLRSQTTYSINFGQAIQDYNEGNPADNFKFVFSTGPYLDSLSLKGQVVDVETGKPLDKIWVMLYDHEALGDSIPALQKPFYATKTNEQGEFLLQNLKADSFQIFALDDKNNNYKYDLPNERIGFANQVFTLSDSQAFVRLSLFSPDMDLQLRDQEKPHPGRLELKFTQKVAAPKISPLGNTPPNWETELQHLGDSSIFWFRGDFQGLDTLLLLVEYADLRDTVFIDLYEWADFMEKEAYPNWASKRKGQNFGKKLASATLDQALRLELNQYIKAFDASRCQLFDDSAKLLPITKIELDSSRTALLLYGDSLVGRQVLVLNPGALQGFYQTQKDSIRKEFAWEAKAALGNLKVKLQHMDSTQMYLLQLSTSQGQVLQSQVVEGKSSLEVDFKDLLAGAYQLRLVEDKNRNGRWDSGRFIPRQQPEPLFPSKSISIRANWDNEMEMDLSPSVSAGKFGKKEE